MKVVYFDVENFEEDFLREKSAGYDFYLESNPLTELGKINPQYLDADVISVFTTSRVSRKVLEQFKNLKLIALRSVGFNHIDIDCCKSRNITVESSPNYGSITVAEFALALLLDTARKVTFSYNEYRASRIEPKSLMGVELFGKTAGIAGLGAIGAEFARIAHGLGMNILAFDKFEKDEMKVKYNVEYTDYDTLLEKSDFISIHAPLTKENYHMFNAESFKKMKNTAILVNTGRGELIDNQALYNALLNGEIAGAGLDVLENEETLGTFDDAFGINRLDKVTLERTLINSRLFLLDNVVITPHTAYNTKEAVQRILETTISNINAFAQGRIQNQVK